MQLPRVPCDWIVIGPRSLGVFIACVSFSSNYKIISLKKSEAIPITGLGGQ
jgi:hypothetical protein